MSCILGLGEVLWDLFPDGKKPGGAPCNVAYHAQVLGNRGVVVSRVGTDALGQDLRRFLEDQGLDTGYLQTDPVHPTGTVTVAFEDGEPHYTITEDVAWDYLQVDPQWDALLPAVEAVCFSTLAQRAPASRAALYALLDRVPASAYRVLDVNLRPPFYTPDVLEASLRRADVVKLNADEGAVLTAHFGTDAVPWILRTYPVQVVCMTLGADGSTLYTRDGHWTQPAFPLDGTGGDFVGAGDAFTATLCHHLVRRTSYPTTLAAAGRYAAFVASRSGAMPAIPESLLKHVCASE